MKTPSPLRSLRRASGLSVSDFADLLQVQPGRLYAAETGSIPSGILQVLEARGVDCATLCHEQREWLSNRRRAVQAAAPDLREVQRLAQQKAATQ